MMSLQPIISTQLVDCVDCVCCGDPMGSDYTLSPCCYQKVCLQCHHDAQQAAFTCPNCAATVSTLPATDYNNQFAKGLLKRNHDLVKRLAQLRERYELAKEKADQEQSRLQADSQAILAEVNDLQNASDLISQLQTRLQAATKAIRAVSDNNQSGLKQLASLVTYLTGVEATLHPVGPAQPVDPVHPVDPARLIELSVNLDTLGQRLGSMVAENVLEYKLRLIYSQLGPRLIQDRLTEQLKCLANENRLRPRSQQTYFYPDLGIKLAAILDTKKVKLDLIELPNLAGPAGTAVPADFLMVFKVDSIFNQNNKLVLVNSAGEVVYHREGYLLGAINHKWMVISKDNRFYLDATPNGVNDSANKIKLKALALSQAGKVKGNGNWPIQVVGLAINDQGQDILYLSRGYRLLTYHITAEGQLELISEVVTTVRIGSCLGHTCSYVVAESELHYCGYFDPSKDILPSHQAGQYFTDVGKVTYHLGEGSFLVNEQTNAIKRMIMTENGPMPLVEELKYRLRWFKDQSAVKLFSDGRLWYLEELGYNDDDQPGESGQMRIQVY